MPESTALVYLTLRKARGYNAVARPLQWSNIFSLWAFLTLSHFELNALAFSQRLEAITSDLTEVSKHVWAAIVLGDETKTFLVIEPLNSTGSSRHSYILKVNSKDAL